MMMSVQQNMPCRKHILACVTLALAATTLAAPAMDHIRLQDISNSKSDSTKSNVSFGASGSDVMSGSKDQERNSNLSDSQNETTLFSDVSSETTSPGNWDSEDNESLSSTLSSNTKPWDDKNESSSLQPSDTKPENSDTDTSRTDDQSKGNADDNPSTHGLSPDASVPEKNGKANDPCQHACTPRIDSKVSVIESYKRHRANVALIGDYGSCKPATSGQKYTWEIEWGDNEEYNKELTYIGPFQAEHIYAKKGKYNVDVTFCSHTEGCDSGCTTIAKKIHVKP